MQVVVLFQMKKRINFFVILFLPVQLLLYYLISLYPETVEQFYTNGLFRFITFILNSLTSPIPFSLGEAIIYLLFIYLIIKAALLVKNAVKKNLPLRGVLMRGLTGVLSFASILYFLIMISWGINYFRPTLQNLAKYKEEKPSINELKTLCSLLIPKCNKLRDLVNENKNGVMQIDGGHEAALNNASEGYFALSDSLPYLKGNYGTPKKFFLPTVWSFFGTSGIYIPFTAEANAHMAQPDPMIPAVICHELAHKVGFAKEDEANFIAFLVCRAHPNIDFQYSGYLLALSYTLSTLRAADEQAYEDLRKQLSEKVERDFKARKNYWRKYSGALMEITSEFYNFFLKANQQEKGIESYGEMVNLLIGELRREKRI